MTTLELSVADDPIFGDTVISTSHFLAWLNDNHLALPACPQIKTYAYLQVYALLAEIEAYTFQNLPQDKAASLAIAGLAHPEYFRPTTARMTVSSRVGDKWRELLVSAVEAGELVPLEYASKLPCALPQRAVEVSPDSNATADTKDDDGHEWKAKAWNLAESIYAASKARGWGYDKKSVANEVAQLLDQLSVRTKTGLKITADFVIREAFKGWSTHFGVQEKRKFQQDSQES